MEPSNNSRIADPEFSSGSDSEDLGFVIVHRHRDGIYDKKDGDPPCVDLRLISGENSVCKDDDLASDGDAAGKSGSDQHPVLIHRDESVTFGSSVSGDEITLTQHDDCCFHGNDVSDENLTIVQPNGHGYQGKNILDGDLSLIPSQNQKQCLSACGSGASNNFENEDHGFVLIQGVLSHVQNLDVCHVHKDACHENLYDSHSLVSSSNCVFGYKSTLEVDCNDSAPTHIHPNDVSNHNYNANVFTHNDNSIDGTNDTVEHGIDGIDHATGNVKNGTDNPTNNVFDDDNTRYASTHGAKGIYVPHNGRKNSTCGVNGTSPVGIHGRDDPTDHGIHGVNDTTRDGIHEVDDTVSKSIHEVEEATADSIHGLIDLTDDGIYESNDTIGDGEHISHDTTAIETSTTDTLELDDTSAERVNALIDASAVEADMLEDTKADGINGLKNELQYITNCCISETDEEDDIYFGKEGCLIKPLDACDRNKCDKKEEIYKSEDEGEDFANFVSIVSADEDEHKTAFSSYSFSRDFYDSKEFDNEFQESLNVSRAMEMMQYLTKSQLQCMAEYCGLGHNILSRDVDLIIDNIINWRQERGDFKYNKHSDNCFESDIEDLSFIPFEMDGVTKKMLRMCFLKCDLQHECLLRNIPYESSDTKKKLISKLMKFKNDSSRKANTFDMLKDSSN